MSYTEFEIQLKPKETGTWLSSAIAFIRRSFLEPIIFLNIIALVLTTVPLQQIVQDKICLQDFNQDREYCKVLSTAQDSVLKDNILSTTSTFWTYKQYIVLIPQAISCLYIGSWCDRFKNGKRYCLLLTLMAMTIQNLLFLANAMFMDVPAYFIVVAHLPCSFFGQGFGVLTCIFSFVATHVDNSEKVIRFILLELAASAGQYSFNVETKETNVYSSHSLGHCNLLFRIYHFYETLFQ